ncbi:MAG: hypothetical protein ACWA45_05350 [Flavobacteriales bacterium]
MKKIILLFGLSIILFSCNQNSEKKKLDPNSEITEVTKNLAQFNGEFIYTEEAAVLKGKDFIYGVVMNETAKELAKKVAKVKKDEFDMVPVTVKGILNKKPANAEGWDEIITIKEIIKVSQNPTQADIKIESKK